MLHKQYYIEQEKYEKLIAKKNQKSDFYNGIFDRYTDPVLTREHAPLHWKYDLNPETNPYFMERLGINAVMNSGAIEMDGKYYLVARVEGNDRKSFFAVAESDTGIDGFHFWDYPIQLPDTCPEETNVYDMRLTKHEDGYIYGVFCSESKDTTSSDLSAAVAEAGIVRTRDLKTWERLDNLKTLRSPQQRNVVLHPEFVDGKYAIRQVYDGQVTYNTDKYQENHVTWWDCLDIISSSGYYPSGKWEQELDRIENIVTKYQKPFFFAEVGCMSRKDSQYEPNNWELTGELRLEEQAEWFEEMFTACERRNWISGFGIWEWGPALPKREDAQKDTSYQICKKPAQEVVYNHFTKKERAPFETLTSEKVKVGRFTVVEDRVRVNNHEQPYDYLEIKGGVSIFAVKDGKIIVQQQYRYPIRSWQWELPGGFVDEGESCEEAAIRELKEETGYEAKKVYSLGAFYPSFGSTNEQIHLFAIECGEKGESEREPGELLSVTEMPVEKFKKLIASGQFMHGAGLAAWARYSLMIE